MTIIWGLAPRLSRLGWCSGLVHSRCSAHEMEPPDSTARSPGSPLHGCTEPPGTLEQRAILWVLNLFPPSSLIYFVIDFGGLMRRLSSGRAGDKVTGSQGLSALCSGFYLPDFMRLEPWLPLSWRNVKMILNHRVQARDRRMLVTHLPLVSLVPSPWQGGDVCLERACFILSMLLRNHNVRIGGGVVGAELAAVMCVARRGCSQ